MTELDRLWYRHVHHCRICVHEDQPRCKLGELIYLQIVEEQKEACEEKEDE